ncbi:MAG: Flp pilus assembly complex ATPase component TadA, partial [Planctomycetaceae bacterium]|nr:Flp pilus assembly complex ATPase component TadA [Planctomycetaceae bacterium]
MVDQSVSGVHPRPVINNSNESGIGRSSDAVRELLTVTLKQSGPAAFCEMLFERADMMRATDIHLDPSEDGTHLRFRVDGFMHDVTLLENDAAMQVISRIKLLAGMDITDRRLAQDGHLSGLARKGKADIRIGTGPTIHGERMVMRLMPDPEILIDLESLGMVSEQCELVRSALAAAGGMMLVVGPVGSGKSTTTYACLSHLNRPDISTVTIEDPVERRVRGASQIQVDPRIDFGFVQALRGVLRQDPDVIMIGEIRDAETANIAVRAALTGVNVLSTLHASDSSTV